MFYANEFLFIDGNDSRQTQHSQLSYSLDIIIKLVMKVKVSLTITATHFVKSVVCAMFERAILRHASAHDGWRAAVSGRS